MKHLNDLSNFAIYSLGQKIIYNLTLNCVKSGEVVFTDYKRRRQHDDPPPIPGIVRRQKLHMLWITVANDFSFRACPGPDCEVRYYR